MNMKCVILAGGLGSRLSEETELKPKPMVEIGGRPILWHIMKIYAHFGVQDFFIALGYKGEVIKQYFLNYRATSGSFSTNLRSGKLTLHATEAEDWNVSLLDTGMDVNTGGRVKRMQSQLDGGTFMVTYGDGVADIDINALLEFHRQHGLIGTVTAVRPPARYGGLEFDGDRVKRFVEKPQAGEGWINGGFLVFESKIFDYLTDDQSSLETFALHRLAEDGQLAAYRHHGFWQCMDTLRDKHRLADAWQQGNAPWKVWEERMKPEG